MLYTYSDVASIMYPFMSFYVLFMMYLDGVHRHSNLMSELQLQRNHKLLEAEYFL